jgi:hypothetical protein
MLFVKRQISKPVETQLWHGLLRTILFPLTITFIVSILENQRLSQWPCGLKRGSWPVGCWDRGFESRSRHGCLSASFCVVLSCVGRGLVTS